MLLQGRYLHDRETLVQAVTRLGAGFWVMTPFETVDGYTVLVNRGFVPPTHRRPATRSQGQIEGETTVIGLLRMSEPKGGFLRANDSATDRWYSRDVAAISAARDLGHSAPYFVDAEAMRPAIAGAPVGGLTVIAFANNHLQYALFMQGRYLHDRETLVQAVTRLGAGFWVMTPLEIVDGYTVLVNRGFVPPTIVAPRQLAWPDRRRDHHHRVAADERAKRRFPARQRQRDRPLVLTRRAAISAARDLGHSAPYFVDAESMRPAIAGAPVGGLTVIAFANNHLQYALTWFALASMLAGGAWLMFRRAALRGIHCAKL